MDYGTIDTVNVGDLRRLLKVFCQLPAQAVETEIPDLAPVGEVCKLYFVNNSFFMIQPIPKDISRA